MERIWCEHYQEGVGKEIDTKPFSSLVESFGEYTRRFNDFTAFSNFGVGITYSQLRQQAEYFASFLQQRFHVNKGDRVALMMPNLLQYPVCVFGCLIAGAVVVNVNPLYTARELRHQLKDSGAETIIICANFAKTLQEVLADTKVRNIVTTELGDRLGFKGKIINFVVKYIKKMVPKYTLEGAIKFNDAVSQGAQSTFAAVELNLDDLAFLQYTGGTTGVSKGAELTHSCMIANIAQLREWAKFIIIAGEDQVITPLPLYHIFSLTVCCFAFLGLGAECMLITNPRDIPGFIGLLKKNAGTIFVGINTLYNALANHPDIEKVDFSRLKISASGGMATQQPVSEKWQAITGTPIVEGYGLTETSPVVSLAVLDQLEFTGSTGLAMPNTDLSIRDDNDNEVALGEDGEIWVKGPQVMRAYWNRPDETAKVLTADGWFKTGDIGRIDNEGRLFIVDRKKDMILVSGFNVYPNEIEEVLVQHEGILEAAAIGVPSEKTGEAIKVFVVKTDPGLTQESLIAYCRKHLTGYKVPREFEFKDELPKTNVGKVLRRMLRD